MVDLIKPKIHETIWEPSSGAGVFLIAIIEYIIKNYSPSPVELVNYVEKYLYFSDVDADALN